MQVICQETTEVRIRVISHIWQDGCTQKLENSMLLSLENNPSIFIVSDGSVHSCESLCVFEARSMVGIFLSENELVSRLVAHMDSQLHSSKTQSHISK